MSQQTTYRGCSVFVSCQAKDGVGHSCRGRTRTTGSGMVWGRGCRMYVCEKGHRFALGVVKGAQTGGGVMGEIDDPLVSGESVDPLAEPEETPETHRHGACIKSDDRRVTLMPSEPPAFGDTDFIPRKQRPRAT